MISIKTTVSCVFILGTESTIRLFLPEADAQNNGIFRIYPSISLPLSRCLEMPKPCKNVLPRHLQERGQWCAFVGMMSYISIYQSNIKNICWLSYVEGKHWLATAKESLHLSQWYSCFPTLLPFPNKLKAIDSSWLTLHRE